MLHAAAVPKQYVYLYTSKASNSSTSARVCRVSEPIIVSPLESRTSESSANSSLNESTSCVVSETILSLLALLVQKYILESRTSESSAH